MVMPKRPAPRVISPAAKEMAALIAREVRTRCGADATFEQRRDMAAIVMQELLVNLAAADRNPEE